MQPAGRLLVGQFMKCDEGIRFRAESRRVLKPHVVLQVCLFSFALIPLLAARRNDLQTPAVKMQPVIAEVLRALERTANCLLARMSGSGATCFGLFGSLGTAEEAAQRMQAAHPAWWVRATRLS